MDTEIILKKVQEATLSNERNDEYDFTEIEGVDYFSFHKDRFRFLINELVKYHNPEKSFLDIGSLRGYMMMAASIIGYKVSGLDLDKFVNEIKDLSTKYSFTNLPIDLAHDRFPFPDESFDVILFSEVLEHLNFHPQKVFLEIARVLKRGGVVIVTTPNLSRLNNIIKLIRNHSINAELDHYFNESTHYREYTTDEIVYLMKEANIIDTTINFKAFKYPKLSIFVIISDIICFFLRKKRRDICVIGKKI